LGVQSLNNLTILGVAKTLALDPKCKFSSQNDLGCRYAKVKNGRNYCMLLFQDYYVDPDINNLDKCYEDYPRRQKIGLINRLKKKRL